MNAGSSLSRNSRFFAAATRGGVARSDPPELRLDGLLHITYHFVQGPYAFPKVALNPHGQSNLEWHRSNEKGHLTENVRRWLSVLQVCLLTHVTSVMAAKTP